MKGVAWDGVGAPQLESAKKAGDLLSEVSVFVQYRRLVCCICRTFNYFNIWSIVT